MKRREFIASSAALAASTALGRPRGGSAMIAPTGGVWRGMGQGMQAMPVAMNGGTGNFSWLSRIRSYSNCRFRFYRVVVPFFWTNGSLVDAFYSTTVNFQVGIEYPWTAALSGIPTTGRTTTTWSGVNFIQASTTPGTYYAISDIMDMGSVVPAGTYFGVWMCVENPLGSGNSTQTYGGLVPSNFMPNRFIGYQQSTTTSFIGANAVSTATSISAATSSQGGGGAMMTPSFLLVQDLDNIASVACFGDSIAYGVGEGGAGSSTFGDSLGSQQANAGWMTRYVDEGLALNHINISRGSDSYANLATSANWTGRQALLSISDVTHVCDGYGHNDLTNPLSTIASNANAAYTLLRGVVGNIPIIKACQTPYSTSPDLWSTPNQTAQDPTSRNGINANARALTWGNNSIAGFVDMNANASSASLLEYNYTEGGTPTTLWVSNGFSNGYTQDGIHPNSFGHYTAAGQGGTLPYASLSGVPVSNPFVI